jgi:hypothetical protein
MRITIQIINSVLAYRLADFESSRILHAHVVPSCQSFFGDAFRLTCHRLTASFMPTLLHEG